MDSIVRITNYFASQIASSSLLSTELLVGLIELSANQRTLYDVWHITQEKNKELIEVPIRKLAFLAFCVSDISQHRIYENKKSISKKQSFRHVN